MGEESDAHCILQPSQIDDAKKVEAVISKIDRRKGYVKLPCGLEAFFPANEFNSLEDENKFFNIFNFITSVRDIDCWNNFKNTTEFIYF